MNGSNSHYNTAITILNYLTEDTFNIYISALGSLDCPFLLLFLFQRYMQLINCYSMLCIGLIKILLFNILDYLSNI
jgi:hypothetical protein